MSLLEYQAKALFILSCCDKSVETSRERTSCLLCTKLFSERARLWYTSYHFQYIAFTEDLIDPASILHHFFAVKSLKYIFLARSNVPDQIYSSVSALLAALNGNKVCYWTILLRCLVHRVHLNFKFDKDLFIFHDY